ncbi:ImmA/IrrE family metallo-endopeptidase [Microvirga pudoricolor]|uniref:ImmA/IrrE family metallo-endopeptidase n=1 Tax=Microvirga pudoricolor TaxID=2778729 RepID=UPI00194E5994|nr:ImmA/IrrE family metallo-endopeptidase [Microvirga pudoricolor]MBM6595842.1 ImmA/IrrE family metallo-endopeptidase [Microvirga pudoricolor]
MGKNFKAPHFWREEDLARLATKHRALSPKAQEPNFNVVEFFGNDLPKIIRCPIKVSLRNLAGHEDWPAFVSGGKPELICDDEVWEHSKLGDPDARYILAHEFGHLVLHSGHAQHFSDPNNEFHSWHMEEEGVEWQAHTYARYLLAPDELARAFLNSGEMATTCDIPIWLAKRRWEEVNKGMLSGNVCPNCGDFTVSLTGICFNNCKI